MMTDEGMYMTHFVGGKINKKGMKRRGENRRGGGIIKTTKRGCVSMPSPAVFPWKGHGYPPQLVTIELNEPGGIWN